LTIENPGPSLRIKPGYFYGYTIVITATIIMTVCMGAYYSFGVFLKPIASDFGWSRALTSGAFSISVIVMGLTGLFFGRMNDRFGPRLVLTLSGFLIGIGYLLSYLIDSLWQLYFFYGVLTGVGLGGVFVPLASTVARWFVARRGIMTGIAISGIGIGSLVSPPIANQLISNYDWRISYLFIGGITLVVATIAAQFLKRDPSVIGQVPYGSTQVVNQRVNHRGVDFSLNAAISTSQFWLTFALSLFFGFSLTAIMVHIAPYATDAGISATTAASFISMIGIGSILGRLFLGKIGDRIGYRAIYILCFIMMSLSILWIIFISSILSIYIFALVFGISYGGSAMAQSLLVAELFGMKSHGVIMGATGIGFSIGCAAGPFTVGYIFDITYHYQLGLIISLISAVLALLATILIKPTR
jgi:MFS family permease